MTNQIFTLAELGWGQFYQSQLSMEECSEAIPLRVTEVQRNTLDALGAKGPQKVPVTGLLAEQGITVGDWLLVDAKTRSPLRVLDRKSEIKRRAAGKDYVTQLIAANIDTLFIVSSCNADFNPARLERYLALAHQADVTPVLVLTKADLSKDPQKYLEDAAREMPGHAVVAINARSTDAQSLLAEWCGAGQTVALVGSSGVGKSTLAIALTGQDILTQDIREEDAKGKHTTTARSMYRMLSGGWLIDTPGMRALRLYDVREGVDMVFDDIITLAAACKFNDCAHDSEPGCRVQAEIQAGRLDANRLNRWQKLQREDTRNTESASETRARNKKTNKVYSGGRARAKMKREGQD
ncbi:MAG: ribosome small subunit-dependent GTPase A [Rhodobacteraceae bacterium]|nr:ribosome small subunit-dependent GTPase A [Paracoccaceae bacterium]